MEGPPVPVTGVGPVCPHLLSPLWTSLGLASLRTELSFLQSRSPPCSPLSSLLVPSGCSSFVLLKLTIDEPPPRLLDILSFTRPATVRGNIIIAPLYTEVKRGPERLGNLQGNAQPHSPRFLSVSGSFPWKNISFLGTWAV